MKTFLRSLKTAGEIGLFALIIVGICIVGAICWLVEHSVVVLAI